MCPTVTFDPSRIATSRVDETFGNYYGNLQVPAEIIKVRTEQATKCGKVACYDGRDRDLGWTGLNHIGKGNCSSAVRFHANIRDAGRTHMVAENANIWVLRYCYTTGKGMEAWVENPPKDGMLKMSMVITPSWHAGSTDAEKLKNGEDFSHTNIYNLEVVFPDGKRETMRFDVDGNPDPKSGYRAANPQHASLSPTVIIDMNKYKGQNVIFRGWADGSAGVGGYQEARETILHIA